MHKTFFFSCLVNVFIAVVTWGVMSFHFDHVYIWLFSTFNDSYTVWRCFVYFTMLNNTYQVIAHLFTATTFSGVYWYVPYGSHKTQRLLDFTLSNTLDILGWLCIFIYYKKAHPFPSLLAATHFGAGAVSILLNSTFQSYYIDSAKSVRKVVQGHDPFKYRLWNTFKASFVATDAIVRGYYVMSMM